MNLVSRSASSPRSPEYRKLTLARAVLGGCDSSGRLRHPSMFDPDVISFAHGEGIRRPHPDVVAAGVRSVLDTETSSLENYLFLQRLERLDDRIAERFRKIGVPESTSRNIVVDSGTTKLFLAFLSIVGRKGDVFLASPGFYHPLAAWCEYRNVDLVCVPTKRENDYKLLAEDLHVWWAQNVDHGDVSAPVGLFLFNPTMIGAVYTQKELEHLSAFIIEHELVVLEDVIFAETEFEQNLHSCCLVGVQGMEDRVFTISGGSKVHGLANVRIAWGCGPKAFIKRLDTFITSTSATIPQFAKLMALAALSAPESYLARNRLENQIRAEQIASLVECVNDRLVDQLHMPTSWRAIEVEVFPKAGHSILLSFNALSDLIAPDKGYALRDSIDLTRFFLSVAKVAFAPGLSIGFDGCLLRCSYGCVGAHFTYSVSRRADAFRTAAELVQHYTVDEPTDPELCALFTNVFPEFTTPSVDHEFGFAQGRTLIEEAFLKRVCNAIKLLINSNKNLAQERARC